MSTERTCHVQLAQTCFFQSDGGRSIGRGGGGGAEGTGESEPLTSSTLYSWLTSRRPWSPPLCPSSIVIVIVSLHNVV